MSGIEVPHGVAVRGAEVFDHHFGVNFISTKDEAPGGGALEAYSNAVNDLAGNGPATVRFPGGGVAENADDPAAFTVLDDGVVAPGSHTWEFLEDAAANGWSVSIVLPTWRFLDLGAMEMDTARAAAEVGDYARSLFAAADALGVTIDGFEIGNEFDLMAEKTKPGAVLTGDEAQAFSGLYAEIAATMAKVLAGEIDAAGFDTGDAPWIGVQALWAAYPESWRKPTDFRDAMAEAFTEAGALDAVDALIAHVYPWLELEANPQSWLADDTSITGNLAALDAMFGGGLDWIASEWEVSFGSGDAIELMKDHYDGIKQLEPVVALFSQMVSAGFDQMNLWPVRNGAFTALETLEGEEKPLSYLFDMMSDQLVGTRVLDLNGRAAGTMWEAGDDIHVYGFADDAHAVFYLGSRSEERQSLALDLSAWRGTGRAPLIEVTSISVDDPEAKGYLQGTHVETAAYSWRAFQAHSADILAFSPYEMIVIEVVYAPSAGETETGTAGSDFLFGTPGDDVLTGGTGDDGLHGRAGADFLDGGDGADLIFGGAGGDLIVAGAGDDVVDGGTGQDIVELGAGNDVFRDNGQGRFPGNDMVAGDAGDDVFFAGRGDDVFTGGAGADTFVFGEAATRFDEDTITDFAVGEDVLRIGGQGYGTVEAMAAAFEVFADGGDTIVRVAGAGWITLLGIDSSRIEGVREVPETMVVRGSVGRDVALGGTPFDARILGRGGNDGLYGRQGDDVLYGGRGADWLYGGGGDDRLVDGKGLDRLYGGEGADVFVFRPDDQVDRIFDFEQGTDLIELSHWGVAGTEDLDVSVRSGNWLEISNGDDVILVRVEDAGAFSFAASDFVF